MTNVIDLPAEYKKEAIEKLNELLSAVQMFYMNVRGYHWNVKGPNFFILHQKFEELYEFLNETADALAERVQMLGGVPLHSFTDYGKLSEIKEDTNKSDGKLTVQGVLDGLKVLLKKERDIAAMAAEEGDEATIDLVTGLISKQEKDAWMYNSFLES